MYATSRRLTHLISRRSLSRPGVAASTCGPERSSRICSPFGTPPKIPAVWMRQPRPKRALSAVICTMSSRVGARIRQSGSRVVRTAAALPGRAPRRCISSPLSRFRMRMNAGSRYLRGTRPPVKSHPKVILKGI